MNPTSSQTEIQEIKLKIKNVKAGIAKRDSLQKRREELENFLLETQIKAQHAILKAHQNELSQEKDSIELYKKAKEYEILSKELLHRLTLLDKEIDIWEGIEETEIDRLQECLIQTILRDNPKQQRYFNALNQNQQKWEHIHTQNNKLLTMLHNLEHLITTIQITRKRIKSQGILSYIFGASPNLMVAQCFQGVLTVLKEEKSSIANQESMIENEDFKSLIKELHTYTVELEADCQSRWSYRYLDSIIEKNFIKIQEFKIRFEQFQILIDVERENVKSELEKWLSQF